MSELRTDPIVGRTVIIAKNRASRPNEFEAVAPVRSKKSCPFCPGHETLTPREVAVHYAPDANGSSGDDRNTWRVRAVQNKYPAVAMDTVAMDAADEAAPSQHDDGELYPSQPGIGVHEVIIDAPNHVASTTDMSVEHLTNVLVMYAERLTHHRGDKRMRYGMVFKNVGPTAGASIEHTHSQLFATTIVPLTAQQKLTGSLAYYERHRQCAYCAMLSSELLRERRLVDSVESYVAFCPYAARFPFETWILPRKHDCHFEASNSAQLAELATILHRTIGRIERVCQRPDYNYIIHTTPFDMRQPSHYHWHIEVFPRLTTTAGFEWGTGCFINPVPPEEAADLLRKH